VDVLATDAPLRLWIALAGVDLAGSSKAVDRRRRIVLFAPVGKRDGEGKSVTHVLVGTEGERVIHGGCARFAETGNTGNTGILRPVLQQRCLTDCCAAR